MAKIVRLTEKDVENLVKKIVKEDREPRYYAKFKDMSDDYWVDSDDRHHREKNVPGFDETQEEFKTYDDFAFITIVHACNFTDATIC